MELIRLRRIIRDRWLLLAIGGVLGAASAFIFTAVSNPSPIFEATAAVRFEPKEGQTFTALGDTVSEAQDFATFAASDILSEEIRNGEQVSFIIADTTSARLLFVSRGSSPTQAGDKALALLQAYFDLDPESAGFVDDLLVQVEDDAKVAAAELAALKPEQTEEDQALLSDLDLVRRQIAAIRDRLVALTLADASATPEGQQLNADERSNLNDALSALHDELAALPSPRDNTPSVVEQLRIAALERRMELLTLEYQRLTFRKLGVAGLGKAESVSVVDLTPEPFEPVPMGAGGLVIGALASLLVLVSVNKIKKAVWLAEDIWIPVLGSVAARRVTGDPSQPWYDEADFGPRKESIQRLRSAVEAQIHSGGTTLSVCSHNLAAENVQALATDLAVSLASVGMSVLLVDGDFGSRSALGEYRTDGPSLSGMLTLKPESLGFEAAVASAVDAAPMIRPRLAVMPSGPPPSSPADALAGPQFRIFLEKATAQFDLVLVAVGDIAAPASQVATQRLRRGLLVLTPGRSTIREVEGALFDLDQRQVSVLGAVFLQRSERFVREFPRRPLEVHVPRDGDSGPVETPVSRLSQYSARGESPTQLEQESLKALADDIGAFELEVDRGGSFGTALLASLAEAEPERAQELVVDYLVSSIEDMLSADNGQGGFSEELGEAVASDGFLLLTTVPGHHTVGQWLAHEIKNEVTPNMAMAIIDEMEKVLTIQSGQPTYLDEWISAHFFKRHLVRTEGEPVVWHLTSDQGDFQVLGSAKRLDRARLEYLAKVVTGQRIDELERYRAAARTRGDGEQEANFDLRIDEVGRFRSALGALVGESLDGLPKVDSTSRQEGDVEWRPDWSLGARINLAPFQRAGVLAVEVLSEEEISSGLR